MRFQFFILSAVALSSVMGQSVLQKLAPTLKSLVEEKSKLESELASSFMEDFCLGSQGTFKAKRRLASLTCVNRDASKPADEKFVSEGICTVSAYGWTNSDNSIKRSEAQRDLGSTIFKESIRNVEEKCYTDSQKDSQGANLNAFDRSAQNLLYLGCIHKELLQACVNKYEKAFPALKTNQSMNDFQLAWLTAAGLVPEKFPNAPAGKVELVYTSGVQINKAGLDMIPENIMDPPHIFFDADPNALYTVVIEDQTLTHGGQPLVFYAKGNIKGNDILNSGADIVSYLPNFDFEAVTDASGNRALAAQGKKYLHTVQVYRQSTTTPIAYGPAKTTCADNIGDGRRRSLVSSKILDTYKDLTWVAGTFFYMVSNEAGLSILCEISNAKCLNSPFPFAAKGTDDPNANCGTDYTKYISGRA